METKILQFEKSADLYLRVAMNRREEGDVEGCLSALFSAYEASKDSYVLAEIAYYYAELGDLEASNQYWFYYIACAPKSRWGEAYGELAKNCFELNDIISAAVYANEKAALGEKIEDIEFALDLKEAVEQLVECDNKFNLIDTEKLKKRITVGEKASKFLNVHGYFDAYTLFEGENLSSLSVSECETYFYACEVNGEFEQAKKVLEEMQKRFPDDLKTLSAKCVYYKSIGNDDRAKYCFISLLEYHEKDENFYSEMLNLSHAVGDFDFYKLAIEKLLQKRPLDSSLRFNKAITFLFEKDLENAKKWFIKAYKMRPDNFTYSYYAKKAMSKEANDLLNEKINFFYSDLPKKVKKKAIKRFDALIDPDAKGKIKYSPEIEETINCAINDYDIDFLYYGLVYMLNRCDKKTQEIFLKYLLSIKVATDIKEAIVRTLLACNYKQNFFVCEGNRLFYIKHSKLAFFNSKTDTVYKDVYITMMANSTYWEELYGNRMRKALNKIYLKATELELKFSAQELYCLLNYELNGNDFLALRSYCNDKNIDIEKMKKFINLIFG